MSAPLPVDEEWLDGSDWFGAWECGGCGAIVRREEIAFDRECPRCGVTLGRGVLAYQIGGERYEVSEAEFVASEGRTYVALTEELAGRGSRFDGCPLVKGDEG